MISVFFEIDINYFKNYLKLHVDLIFDVLVKIKNKNIEEKQK